jgi:hypothetical protein
MDMAAFSELAYPPYNYVPVRGTDAAGAVGSERGNPAVQLGCGEAMGSIACETLNAPRLISASRQSFLLTDQRSSVRVYLVGIVIRYHLVITSPRRQRKASKRTMTTAEISMVSMGSVGNARLRTPQPMCRRDDDSRSYPQLPFSVD